MGAGHSEQAVQATGYGFRHSSRKLPAFRGVDLEIAKGEKVLMVGASGAGKSTLLSAIAGVLAPDQGESFGQLQVQGRVGMVLQDPDAQVIAARVGDDVAFGCENMAMPPAEIRRRVPQYLEQVGLDFTWNHDTGKLSGGQQQRLALAGVLAMGADIVCLDEPTANIDPAGVKEVIQAVAAIDSATVIVVEHRLGPWLDVVDRLVVLSEDGVSADGSPAQVLAQHGANLAEAGVWVPGFDPEFSPEFSAKSLSDAPSMQAAVQTTDLELAWQTPGVTHPLNLAFPQGASTVIGGANGAGKSTFLLTLGGLLAPKAGSVAITGAGRNPHQWPARHLARVIGTVFQDPELQFIRRTVEEELVASAYIAYSKRHWWSKDVHQQARAAAEQRGAELLELLGLTKLAKANPFTLSGGQKRRLGLASALVVTPEILLLDEPTFGQDRTTFIVLVELLRDALAAGSTIISVSHDELYRKAMGEYVYDFTA